MICLLLAVGLWFYRDRLPLGVFARHGQAEHVPSQMPSQWPMRPRALLTPDELRVWHWLQDDAFPYHHVLPKLPLTRFTAPVDVVQGRRLFPMLSSAYCSFVVCSHEGQVLGGVDLVTADTGPSADNQRIKRTLLAQCGMSYHLLNADKLPEPEAFSAEVLGGPHSGQGRLDTARQQLHEMLDRNRQQRRHQAEGGGDEPPSWAQADSFLADLEDRVRLNAR